MLKKIFKLWFFFHALVVFRHFFSLTNAPTAAEKLTITIQPGGSVTSSLKKLGIPVTAQLLEDIRRSNRIQDLNFVKPYQSLTVPPHHDPKSVIPTSDRSNSGQSDFWFMASVLPIGITILRKILYILTSQRHELITYKNKAELASIAAKNSAETLTEMEAREKKLILLTKEQSKLIEHLKKNSKDKQLSKELCLEILGLSASATPSEVQIRRRKLMFFYHPDSGSPQNSAKKINAAADFLLAQL